MWWFILGWPFGIFSRRKRKIMATINDLFNEATGDDVTVAADKKKLDDDTAKDVADHKGLTDAVIANGPTIVVGPDGSYVGLIPHEDGTVTNIVFKDGTKSTPPAP